MAKIGIPDSALAGFGVLSELSENQFNNLIDFLTGLSIIDRYGKIEDFFDTISEPPRGVQLFVTISSFSRLVKSDADFIELASDLSTSYAAQSNFQDTASINLLEKRLNKILQNYSGFGSIRNARNLQYQNEIILNETLLFTDIRMVFSENLQKNESAAIIMHKLNIKFTKDDNQHDVYYTLDIDDLRKLKNEIEKSIHKEEILRTSYNELLNFIN